MDGIHAHGDRHKKRQTDDRDVVSKRRATDKDYPSKDEDVMTKLMLSRKIRAKASSSEDLERVKTILRSILQNAPKESSVWVDAGSFLATLLIQEDDDDSSERKDSPLAPLRDATRLLQERGFRYRLSCAALRQPKLTDPTSSKPSRPPSHLAHAINQILPRSLLRSLFEVFGPASSYWTTHDYSDGSSSPPSPYFSYVVPLNQKTTCSPSVLQFYLRHIQHHVGKLIPGVAECSMVEFWAHCRPHSSGHQLHFDSDDEGRGGMLRHPVASTVLYLDGSEHGGDNFLKPMVGGATLVTTQTSKSLRLATQGWLCHAQPNRLLAFAGNRLHGVLPGVGAPPAASIGSGSNRRVTLMVAFWKRIRVQDVDGPGAARPFSRGVEELWAKPLMREYDPLKEGSLERSYGPSLATDCFVPVPVWEDVEEGVNEQQNQSLKQVQRQRVLPSYDAFFQFYS